MRLGELLGAAGIECPENLKLKEISEIVTDSRLASDGCMFVCIKGHNTDGHDFINDAIKKGAVVIVAEQVRDGCVGGAAIIKVDNTRRVAAQLYNIQCNDPSKKLKLVGVTGTNGKTSVCSALESIYLTAGIPCAVIGTLGCRINGKEDRLCRGGLTTPDAAELYPFLAHLAELGVEYVFMEVSSHSLALDRVSALEFEYGVFTNLTRDHLDFHGTMEEYFLAKASLFQKCKKGIINIDGLYGKRLYGMYGGVCVSSRQKSDVWARDISCSSSGSRYILGYKDNEYEIRVGALGDFSVINTLEAAAVALDAGISHVAVTEGLSRFFGAKGRMQRVTDTAMPFDVIIDYAHTPDAFEKVLMCAHSFRGRGRIITVFGCGGDRDRGKRKEMANIASRLSDFCVVTSDNPRSEKPMAIITDILKGIDKEKPYACVVSRKEAIEYALGIADRGDIVLLLGKGHEKYEIDADGKHPFDEENIVREWCLQKKRKALN